MFMTITLIEDTTRLTCDNYIYIVLHRAHSRYLKLTLFTSV